MPDLILSGLVRHIRALTVRVRSQSMPGSRLGFKFLTIISGTLLLGVVLSSVLILFFQHRQLQESTHAYTEHVGIVVQASLEHAMSSGDKTMLDQMLQAIALQAGVQRVSILDTSGRTWLGSTPAQAGTFSGGGNPVCRACHAGAASTPPIRSLATVQVSGDTLFTFMPILNRSTCAPCHGSTSAPLGTLQIETPIANFQDEVISGFWQIVLAAALILLLLAALLTPAVGHWVVQPVVRLASSAREIGRGNLDSTIAAQSDDEVGELARAFDTMRAQLKAALSEKEQRDRELQALNEMHARNAATLEERERLAREMHDSLAQALGYIKLQTLLADDLLSKGQIAQAQANVRQVKEVAKETYSDLREAIFGLRHEPSPVVDFSEALEEYLAEYRMHYGLRVRLQIDSNCRPVFSDRVHLQLTRIIQEALTNIRKHAQANDARVMIYQVDHHWQITIADDGRGFDPRTVPSAGQQFLGLHIMRERAESIGASLELDSRPGGGTSLVLQIPISEKRR